MRERWTQHDGDGPATDPEERLLEHMLERCLAERESPDLAGRVVEAWARGERGSLDARELEQLERPGRTGRVLRSLNGRAPSTSASGEVPAAPVIGADAGTGSTRLRRAAAAALVLAVGGGAWFWLESTGSGAPSEGTDGRSGAPEPPPVVQIEAEVQPPAVPGPGTREERERRFDELVGQVLVPGKGPFAWGGVGYGSRGPAMRELSELLREDESLWKRFAAFLVDVEARGEDEPLTMDRILEERSLRAAVPLTLDFLVQDGSDGALALGLELWERAPEAFDLFHQAALADLGSPVFERECHDLIEIYDPEVDEPPYPQAALFALRGDPVGADVLTGILTDDSPERLDARLLCALALDHLAYPNAWSWIQDRCRRTIEAALEADVREAVRAVLLLEYFSTARGRGEDRLTALVLGLPEALAKRMEEVGTEADVRRLMVALLPE